MVPELKKLASQVAQLLNSATTEGDPNYLGEPWRTQLLEVKGRINASLEDLPETDKVPAAQEASWGLNCLKSALLSVQAIIQNLSAFAQKSKEQSATAMASMTAEIEKGVKTKIESGEYVAKADAEAMVGTARKEGESAGFQRGKLLADRRQALALCGLPAEVVAKAPENVLLAEDETVFGSARDNAKARVELLKSVGLTVASATMQELPWASEEAFKAQHATFTEIQSAAKFGNKPGASQANNSATPTAKQSGLIGGNSNPNPDATKKIVFVL